jgi:hemerythrin-like domain-containing protein
MGHFGTMEVSREQHKLRELIRQIEAGAPDHETAHAQARAFVAVVKLIARHIEWHQQTVFPTIRKTAARAVEADHTSDTLDPILLLTAVTNAQAPNV